MISHERSGTHFLINTIANNYGLKQRPRDIYLTRDRMVDPESLPEHLVQVEKELVSIAAREPGECLKTHLPHQLLGPLVPTLSRLFTVFYMVRDGRGVMNSFRRYLLKTPWPDVPKCETIGEFLQAKPEGAAVVHYHHRDFENFIERWVDHVEGWMGVEGVTLVRYEDLSQDFDGTFQGVIVPATGIDKVNPVRPSMNDLSVLPWKGVVGAWRETFSDEDLVRFESIAGPALTSLGYGPGAPKGPRRSGF